MGLYQVTLRQAQDDAGCPTIYGGFQSRPSFDSAQDDKDKKKSPRRGRAETTRGNIDDTAAKISISMQNPAVEVFYFFNFFIRQLVSDVASQIEYYGLSAVFAFYERRNRQY